MRVSGLAEWTRTARVYLFAPESGRLTGGIGCMCDALLDEGFAALSASDRLRARARFEEALAAEESPEAWGRRSGGLGQGRRDEASPRGDTEQPAECSSLGAGPSRAIHPKTVGLRCRRFVRVRFRGPSGCRRCERGQAEVGESVSPDW